MITSLLRVVAALFALTFIVAACASDSGAEWTFAPSVTAIASATESPSGSTEPGEPTPAPVEPTPAPAEPTPAPAEPTEPAEAATEAPTQPEATEPTTTAGEARVIALEATGTLQFTQDGQQIRDIPVTPGETVIFQIDNTAGFAHNFYIGEDSELITPSGSTDTGIPDWSTGVQELEWVVPDDIANLKFGCTVPGHYTLMQGVFSAAEGGAPAETASEPEVTAAPEEPAESMAPEESMAPAAGDARVIALEATGALQFTQDGQQIRDIPVTPGETVVFQIDNTAGFPHNFYIGEDSELSAPAATTDVGIPDWDTGVQELEWVVPDDIANLKFGCTVPGHYTLMQGTFSVSP